MNSLLRSELLGEPAIEFSLNNRMDGISKSPRRDSSSSNLFKYRNQGSTGSLESHLSAGSDLSHQSFASTNSPVAHRHVPTPKKPTRKISKAPFKILDAPALQDDYYLNLVDWSHNNVLSVALGSSVYLWSACTSKVGK
jgi:cell division cycle 20-like protein 1, cofactor of APC complex